MWKEALFTYFITDQENQLPKELPEHKIIGAYHIAHSLKTRCEIVSGETADSG